MAVKVTIGGVDKTTSLKFAPAPLVTLALNNRDRFTFTTVPGYEPARFAEVVAYGQDGVTAIFGGMILQRRLQGLGDQSPESVMVCECVSFAAYLDWCYLNLTYAADTTLQAVLDDLIDALPAGYGISLDATDYSGIALSAFTWSTMRASDALRELSDRTGRIVLVSPAKVLSMPLPGGAAAPGDITDATPNIKDLSWSDATTPATTTITLVCGTGQAWVDASWTADGSATSWVTDIPAAGPTRGYVTVGGVFATLGLPGDEATASYIWTAATHTLSLGTASTPAASTVIVLAYLAQYPFTVSATTGGSPDIAEVQVREDVFDLAQAQEIADGLLDSLSGSPRTLEARSLLEGWAPGQEVDVDLTDRSIDATFAITEVDIEMVTATHWEYQVRATELTVAGGTYLEQWRALLGGMASGSTASVGTSTGTTVIGGALPTYDLGGSRFHAVQVPA